MSEIASNILPKSKGNALSKTNTIKPDRSKRHCFLSLLQLYWYYRSQKHDHHLPSHSNPVILAFSSTAVSILYEIHQIISEIYNYHS